MPGPKNPMDAVMKVDKISISFEADLGDRVRDAARKAGTGFSRG
jgi:hypothetical protein